ncbi:hypothetical protein R1flu_011242 [Riccia fluitans]|uniref:Uncharacterized protein n=1 Tax=Riccia fluitans TaxID=41844 RepID=A0ABD1Z819_9MARC
MPASSGVRYADSSTARTGSKSTINGRNGHGQTAWRGGQELLEVMGTSRARAGRSKENHNHVRVKTKQNDESGRPGGKSWKTAQINQMNPTNTKQTRGG